MYTYRFASKSNIASAHVLCALICSHVLLCAFMCSHVLSCAPMCCYCALRLVLNCDNVCAHVLCGYTLISICIHVLSMCSHVLSCVVTVHLNLLPIVIMHVVMCFCCASLCCLQFATYSYNFAC